MPAIDDIVLAENYVREQTRVFPALFGRLLGFNNRRHIIRATIGEMQLMKSQDVDINTEEVLRRVLPSIRRSSLRPRLMPVSLWIMLAQIIIKLVVAYWLRKHKK